MSRLMHLVLATLLASAVLVASGPGARASDCAASASAGGSVFNAAAECPDDPPPVDDRAGGQIASGITYSYAPVCIRGDGIRGDGFYGCGGEMRCGADDEGSLFDVWAHYPSGATELVGTYCYQPGEVPMVQQVTPGDVLEAFRRVPVPASRVVVQPPGGKTLVNLETIFSTEAEGFSRTVGLLGHRVELAISPSSFRWVNGDGSEQVTDWPGRSWAREVSLGELITHRYLVVAELVRPRVDTTWSARYRVDGGPWRDVGGTVTITGEPFDLRVLEASPALVG